MALLGGRTLVLGKRQHDESPYSIHCASKRTKRSTKELETTESVPSDDDSDFDPSSDVETQSSASTPPAPQSQPATPASKASHRPLKYKCTYNGCGKSFSRPIRLEEHIRSHTKERPLKCPHTPCNKDFRRQNHLNHHIKSAHTSQRDYVCDWQGCGKSFATGTRLRRHHQAHEKRDTFRCTGYPPCDKSFRKHSTLQRHIDANHLHLKPFLCTRTDDATGKPCAATFDSPGGLRSHEARCHEGKQYWCSICRPSSGDDAGESPENAGFTTYAELQTHMKLQHPPQCNHCGLTCSTPGELQRHIDLHHSGVSLEDRRSFKCPELGCGKGFTKQGNLNIHIRSTHEKKKPFVCGETDLSRSAGLERWDASNSCHRGFTAKASLETHVRKFHLDPACAPPKHAAHRPATDSKTYKQTPSTSTRLTGSGYAEESGRSLVCPISSCEHRFKRHADLRSHTRAAHGLEDADAAEALAESEALSGGRFWLGGADDFFEERDDDDDVEDWRELTGADTPAVNIGAVGAHGFTLPSGEPPASAESRKPRPAYSASPVHGDDGKLASLITSCLADDVVDPALLRDS